MKWILLGTLILTQNSFAREAEPESLKGCVAEAEVGKKVEYCDFNELYVRAAKKCDESLKIAAKILQIQILKEFKLQDKDSQRADAKEQKDFYEDSKIRVNALIIKAETSRKELEEYLKYLVYPEDSDVEEQNKGNPQKYAMSIHCYGDHRKELERVIASFDSKVEQLKTTRSALQSKEVAVGEIMTGLEKVNNTQLLAPGKPIPAKAPKESRGFRKNSGGVTEDPGIK